MKTSFKKSFKKEAPLHQVKWLRVVLDEGHCIRNLISGQSKACIALEADRRWVVTGDCHVILYTREIFVKVFNVVVRALPF